MCHRIWKKMKKKILAHLNSFNHSAVSHENAEFTTHP